MTRRLAFGISGDYAQLTGGYAYDRRLLEELRLLGWDASFLDVGGGFPQPSEAAKRTAALRLLAVPPGIPLLVDGLVYGVLPDTARTLRAAHPLTALVHHPLALETGWTAEEATRLREHETAALAEAHLVVTTSGTTAEILLRDYGVDAERLVVALPGSDAVASFAQGSSDRIVRLLAVGSIVPRKGYDILLAALSTVVDLPWRLTIAGDPDRHPTERRRVEADIERCHLAGRVTLAGAVPPSDLAGLYASADLFVLASRYEGYGMAYAEAIAHGLPVIGTTGGAIPQTVPAEAAFLVPPEDVAALAGALRRLIGDADARSRLSAAARAGASQLPTWDQCARRVASAIEAII